MTDITAHNIQSPSESGVVTPGVYWADSPESVAFKQPWVPQLGDNLQTCLGKLCCRLSHCSQIVKGGSERLQFPEVFSHVIPVAFSL